MARILSRDRDKDPFDDDEAERRFLQSKPVCFIIFGKPGCGKTTLAKKLAKTWKCELVNGSDPLVQGMELSTELGVKAQTILSRGEALPEELASQIVHDKIDSPEVAHHGYVLDGFPSLCEDWLSMKEQLEFLKTWKYNPDFIINLKIPDRDLENRRVNQRVDPVTNKIYTKDVYDPAPPGTVDEPQEKVNNENTDGEDEQGEDGELSDDDSDDDDDDASKNFSDEEEDEGFPKEIFARLVVRPEDLPENVRASIKRYKDLMLRMLEDYMADHDQQKLIEIDANLPPKAVFKILPCQVRAPEREANALIEQCIKFSQAVMTKLNTFGLCRALTTLRLQTEDSEEIANDADADDMLRSLAAAEMVAPRFRWRRSRWGRLCPVELYNGNIVNGAAQFAVSFLDKMYCLSSSEALATFIRNPRPYLMEPNPCPPCKICVVGPPCSGKTTLAKSIAQRYRAQYLNIDVLIQGTKQEAKRKLLEEIREEAIESAIAKVNIQIQLAREEEEERLAAEAEANQASHDTEQNEDEEDVPNDVGEEEELNGEEMDGSKVEEDEEKLEEVEEQEEVKEQEEAKDEVVVDQNHPEVIKLVNAAMKEAEHREADISADEYVDVVEEAIQSRLKEVEEAKAKGQRLGGYVLDSFPLNREQFTLLIERVLMPDSVICLKDDSEQGSFLAERWTELRRAEKYLPDIQEVEDKTEVGGEMEDAPQEEKETETDTEPSPEAGSTVKKPPLTDKDSDEYQEYLALKTRFENNWQQLAAIIKGTNNLEPIIINCERDIDTVTDDAIKAIEETFIYHPWEYTGMDEDEEEEDAEEDDEFVEEEENDVFNKDLGRKMFGDTKHYCPVMLKQKGVLWPGMPECAAKYRERVYFFSSVECRQQFLDDPTQYLPVDRPLKPPPIRLFITGPKGCGKTLHGRYLAEKLGVFHIDFQERLQELIIAKTKKRVGPDYEDDEPENEVEEGEKGEDEDDKQQEDENKEEEEMNLTEEEELIYVSLTEGEHLQRDTVESILSPWWNEEPFRSRGFVLEGFPRNEDETRVLSMSGFFPDAAILLGVEDTDIIDRLLPGKLEKWKVKRDKRLAKKAKQKEIALKAKEEARAKRKNELLLQIAEEKALKKARMEENGDEGDDEEDDEDEEMDETDIDAILDGEFEEDEDLDEDEEETEEDATDRLRVEITDRYDEDTARLGVVQDSLEESLIPRVEIDAGRKPRIVRYCIDEALKPIIDFREALFSRCHSLAPALANRMLAQGYKFPSRFGKWCPVKLLEGDVIQPHYPRGSNMYPVAYRQHVYYLSSEKAKTSFMNCPMKYLRQPSPKPMVAIQMAIIGPPKSGKTTLANRFVAEYGVVRLSIGEVIRRVLTTQPSTDLVRQINHHLRTGCTVPDDLAIQALDVVLMDPQCQVKGYILDGFPMTKRQIELMTERSIIPVNVLELEVDDDEVFKRATQDRRSPSRTYPVHDSHTIISIRLACWKREVEAVRQWYENVQRNWTAIDGTRSKWLVWKTALDEAKRNIQDIQVYLVRIAEGRAASIANMCVTPKEFTERLGDFGEYCPVSLADYGHLVDCSDNSSLEFAAEFRGRYYKMETAKELQMFLENPTAYVPPLAPRALPPPELLPRRRTATEMKEKFPCQIELQGYCPVTFLDGKKRYESIVPGDPEFVVEYRGAFYTFESEKKLDAFLRTPEKYHGLSLPRKLPPRSTPLAIHQLPMLGFLEQTVSEAIIKALTSVGCFKPKYPFVSAKRSALLYVAYHLKAFNPKSSEYVRKKYKGKLKKFEERCNLITYLGRNMSGRYREPFQRPFDFDVKMKNFLELKVLRPTYA